MRVARTVYVFIHSALDGGSISLDPSPSDIYTFPHFPRFVRLTSVPLLVTDDLFLKIGLSRHRLKFNESVPFIRAGPDGMISAIKSDYADLYFDRRTPLPWFFREDSIEHLSPWEMKEVVRVAFAPLFFNEFAPFHRRLFDGACRPFQIICQFILDLRPCGKFLSRDRLLNLSIDFLGFVLSLPPGFAHQTLLKFTVWELLLPELELQDLSVIYTTYFVMSRKLNWDLPVIEPLPIDCAFSDGELLRKFLGIFHVRTLPWFYTCRCHNKFLSLAKTLELEQSMPVDEIREVLDRRARVSVRATSADFANFVEFLDQLHAGDRTILEAATHPRVHGLREPAQRAGSTEPFAFPGPAKFGAADHGFVHGVKGALVRIPSSNSPSVPGPVVAVPRTAASGPAMHRIPPLPLLPGVPLMAVGPVVQKKAPQIPLFPAADPSAQCLSINREQQPPADRVPLKIDLRPAPPAPAPDPVPPGAVKVEPRAPPTMKIEPRAPPAGGAPTKTGSKPPPPKFETKSPAVGGPTVEKVQRGGPGLMIITRKQTNK
jgi:hypothetical protein